MNTRVLRNIYFLCCLFLVFLLCRCSSPSWDELFCRPPAEARPWTFWYWMYGCVSDEGIRADLQAMKDGGLEGFYLMPIRSAVDDKNAMGGSATQLSDEWWQRMHAVVRIADSLGLQMGIHICDGFALAGGPWIRPSESMKRVVWADTVIVAGNGGIDIMMPMPNHYSDYYEDIAAYVYPASDYDARKPYCDTSFPIKAKDSITVVFRFDELFTLHGVRILTGGNNYQAHRWKVFASTDGKTYAPCGTIEPARQGWQNTDAPASYALPATAATYFKFCWNAEGSDPGSEDMDAAKWNPTLKVKAIELLSESVIDGFEGKNGCVWRVSGRKERADGSTVSMQDVKRVVADSCGCVRAEGLEEGQLYHLLRMGYTSTGHTNATGGGGRGLECDKFSVSAVKKQFANWFGRIKSMSDSVAPDRSVLTRVHVDSWECGSQNWGDDFPVEFQRRRGYDLLPWLPVMAGVPMDGIHRSEEVLRDVRVTIGELLNERFFGTVRRLADKCDVRLSAECVAPTMVSDGLTHYRSADYPMGEFWFRSPTHDKPNDMLDAVSGAHIYGKNTVSAEAFTEVRGTWDETPAMLKPLLDRSFCMGINSIVYHVMTHNPWLDRRPGMTLDGIGCFFQRDNTWWKESISFSDYIARCQALLQYGDPVVDLAVYTGGEMPRRSLLPERLIASLPGLFGSDAVEREIERLRNDGIPMETSPVGVRHTRNMTKADMFTNPLRGYKYDSFSLDALRGMSVDDKDIITASGMRYRAVVVPQSHKLNPDGVVDDVGLIAALHDLGAIVVDTVWNADDMRTVGIVPDAELPKGIDFAHRTAPDADIYFLSNQTSRKQTFRPMLRDGAKRRYSYWADAVDGTIGIYEDGLVSLDAYGSLFIVRSDKKVGAVANNKEASDDANNTLTLNSWKILFHTNGEMISCDGDTLGSWTKSDNPAVRFYSGRATYASHFDIDSLPQSASLLIDSICDIATVRINGTTCGIIWTKPFCCNISKALNVGSNTIEIDVVNTWANALMGADRGTPPFDGIWTNARYRNGAKEPIPAGLIGRVRVRFDK